MTSITWAGPRCGQELATILAHQNRIQGRCDIQTFWDKTRQILKRIQKVFILQKFKQMLLMRRGATASHDGTDDDEWH